VNPPDARITIDVWRTTYLMPSSHPAPDRVRNRLDSVVTAQVPEACARWLSTALDPADESIWLVRELDLDFAVDIGHRTADRLPNVWAKQLAIRIGRVMTETALGDNVMYFPNRAAYLAHFARDLATSRAWDKWWYDEFGSLRALSPGRAIREALRNNAAEVLVHLAGAGGLHDVLGVLSPGDARAMYQDWRGTADDSNPTSGVRKWTAILLELWRDKPLRSEQENLFRDGLWMAALAGACNPGAKHDRDFVAALDGLLELRSVLGTIRSATALDDLIRKLAGSNVGEAAALAASAGAKNPYEPLRFFAQMMQGDADWAQQAAGILLSEDFRRRNTSPEPIRGQTILSRFGGILRLGPSLAALGFDEPGADAAIFRHLIAVKCLGGVRARETASDAAVRLFSGCAAPIPEALGALERSDALLKIQNSILARYRGASLMAEPVMLPGGDAVLFRDVLENEWVWAAPAGERAMQNALTSIRAVAGAEPEVVTADPAQPPKPAQPHVTYFSLGACWPTISLSLDLVGTIAARAVLRHFAGRLIGFNASGPDHLYTNFLAGRTTLDDTGYRLDVEITPPPLSVVLRMAGIHEEVYSAPWIEREVWLRQTSE
jgi:hypothetical protein